jgi:hypothetical protein
MAAQRTTTPQPVLLRFTTALVHAKSMVTVESTASLQHSVPTQATNDKLVDNVLRSPLQQTALWQPDTQLIFTPQPLE